MRWSSELALIEKTFYVLFSIIVLPKTYAITPPQNWDGYALLEKIAACENTGDVNGVPRQFNDDGTPLWGNSPTIKGATTTDVGILQISLKYHQKEIDKLKLDVVNSAEDNVKYGKILFDREGTKPWNASKSTCWGKSDLILRSQ